VGTIIFKYILNDVTNIILSNIYLFICKEKGCDHLHWLNFLFWSIWLWRVWMKVKSSWM